MHVYLYVYNYIYIICMCMHKQLIVCIYVHLCACPLAVLVGPLSYCPVLRASGPSMSQRSGYCSALPFHCLSTTATCILVTHTLWALFVSSL